MKSNTTKQHRTQWFLSLPKRSSKSQLCFRSRHAFQTHQQNWIPEIAYRTICCLANLQVGLSISTKSASSLHAVACKMKSNTTNAFFEYVQICVRLPCCHATCPNHMRQDRGTKGDNGTHTTQSVRRNYRQSAWRFACVDRTLTTPL